MEMDHVVLPLDVTHQQALEALQSRARRWRTHSKGTPHVTVATFTGLERSRAADELRRAVAHVEPFTLRAHGFGIFTGGDGHRTLHVQVVRGPALEVLHAVVVRALEAAGGSVAEWTGPELWTPHITVLDEATVVDGGLGTIGDLVGRHHPSWRIPVDRLLVMGSAGSDVCVEMCLLSGRSSTKT
jgi:2'-5' RNA ligase